MNETKLTTIGQISEFLTGTADVYWMPGDDDKARYAFIRNVLSRFITIHGSGVLTRGVIRAYLAHTSGYSRAQLARLIRQYLDCGRVVHAGLLRDSWRPSEPFEDCVAKRTLRPLSTRFAPHLYN